MAKKQNFTTDSRQNMSNYLGTLNKNLYTTSEGSPVEFEEIAPIKLQTQPLNTVEFDDVYGDSNSVGNEPTSKDSEGAFSYTDNVINNIAKAVKVVTDPVGSLIKAEADLVFKPKEDGSSWKDAAFSFIESIWVDDVNRNLGAINLNNQEIEKLSGFMSDTQGNQQMLKDTRAKMDDAALRGNREDYLKYKQEYDNIKDNFKKTNEAVSTKINSLTAQNEKLKTDLQDARNDVNDLNSIYTLNTTYKNQRDNGEFGFFDPDYWFYKVPQTLGTSFSSIQATGAAMAASAATNYIASSATGVGAHPAVAGGAAILGAGATMYSTLWARNRESLSEVSTNYKSLFKESANKLGIDSDELAKVGRQKLRDLTGYAYSEDPNSKDYRDNEAVLEDMLAYNIKIGDIAPQAKELDNVTGKAKNKLRDLYNSNMALGIGDVAQTAVIVPGVGKMFGKVLGKLNLPEIAIDKTVKALDKTIATIATKAGSKVAKPVLERGSKYLVDPAVRIGITSAFEGVEEVTQFMLGDRLKDDRPAQNVDLYNPFDLGKMFAENQYLGAKGMLGVMGISGDPALDSNKELVENFKGGIAVSLLMGGGSQVLTPTSDNAIAKAASFKKGNDLLRYMTTENIKGKEDMFKYIQYADKARGRFTNKEALLDAIDAQIENKDIPQGWTQEDLEQEKKNISNMYDIVNSKVVSNITKPADRSIGAALIKRAADTYKTDVEEYNKIATRFNAVNTTAGSDFSTLNGVGEEDKNLVNAYISSKSKLKAIEGLIKNFEDKEQILTEEEFKKVIPTLDDLYIQQKELNNQVSYLQAAIDRANTLDSFAKQSIKDYINNNVADTYSLLLLADEAIYNSRLDYQNTTETKKGPNKYLQNKIDRYKSMIQESEDSLNEEQQESTTEEEKQPEVTPDTVAAAEEEVTAKEQELVTAEAEAQTQDEVDAIQEQKAELEQQKIEIEDTKRTVVEDEVEHVDTTEAISVRTPNLSYDEFDPSVAEMYNEDKEEASMVEQPDVTENEVYEEPAEYKAPEVKVETKVEPEVVTTEEPAVETQTDIEEEKVDKQPYTKDETYDDTAKTPDEIQQEVIDFEQNDVQYEIELSNLPGTLYFNINSDVPMFKGYKSGKELNEFLSTPGNIASSIFTAVIGKPDSRFGSYKVDNITTWDNAPVYVEITATNGDKYITVFKTIQGARDLAIQHGKAFTQEEEDNLRKLRNSIIEVKTKYPNSIISFTQVNSTNGILNVNRDSEDRAIQRNLLEIKGFNIPNIYAFNDTVNSKIGIGKGLVGQFLIYNGNDEFIPGRGGSGKLYYYISGEQTINGNPIPVKLNEARFVKEGEKTNAITDYLTSVILDRETGNEYLNYTDIFSIVANYGKSTILREDDPRYSFMKDKQFFVDYSKGIAQLGTEQVTIESLLSKEGRKKLSTFIGKNLHWNTDKGLLFSSLNNPAVDTFVSLKNAVKNAIDNTIEIVPGVKIGLSDFGLTKDAKGQIVPDTEHPEGLKLISFLVNKGLLTSDLQDQILTKPFVYVNSPTVTYVKEDPVVEKPVSNKENKSKTEPVEETKSNTSTQDDIDLASEGTSRRKHNLSYDENFVPEVEEEATVEEPKLTENELTTNNALIDDWLGLDGAPKVLTREQIREAKRINTVKATKWLKAKLGLDDSQVEVIDGVFRQFANGAAVYGITHQDSIGLSKMAIEGVQYHEAWHRVSLLLLNKEQRQKLYTEFKQSNKKYANASDKVIEEALADKFMDFMLNDKEGKVRYFINKVFRIMKKFIGINTNMNNKDLTQIFNAIKYGEFSKYKLDEESKKDFLSSYGNNINYKVGKNHDVSLVNFPLKSDFDSAISSLKSALFLVNGVKYFSDINKLNTANLKKFLQSCILSDKFTDANKAALQEIVDKFDVFMNSLMPQLEAMGIRAIDKEQEDDQADREEGKEQSWDKAAFEYDKKGNALSSVKMFLSTLTDSYFTYTVDEKGNKHRNLKVRRNNITGLPMTISYDVAFAQTLKYLSDVDVYSEDLEHPNIKSLIGESAKLAEMNPFFNVLYSKLTKVEDINLQTQLLQTIKSFNQNFIEVNYSYDEKNKVRFKVDDGINQRAIKQLPTLWSDNFFNSELIIQNEEEVKPNISEIERIIEGYNILKSDIANNKNISDADIDSYKVRILTLLNKVGITVDGTTIDHILGKNRESNLKDLIVNNKSRVTLDYLFNGTLNTLTGKNLKKNQKPVNLKSVFLGLGKNSGLNNLAEVHAIAHPDDSNISVLGPNNSVIYTKTLNCFVSDQVRWLNQHDEETITLLNNDVYNKSSLILSAVNHNAPIKLNTFVNFYGSSVKDKGRDYVSIYETEDYVAKMVLTFNNHIIFPTMADKKTWFTISGVSLYNKPFKFQERDGKFTIRFDQNTLEHIYNMWLDEFNTIKDYYANINNVKNPINNYHTKGFGGLFRHYKGHYSKNKEGVLEWIDLNDTIKQALDIDKKNKNHDSINATLQKMQDELFGNPDDKTKFKIVHDKCLEYINYNLLKELDQEKETCAKLGIIELDSQDKKSLKNKLIDQNIIDYYVDFYKDSNVPQVRENAEKYAALTAIANHMVNQNVSTVETEKIFTGDLAYYKDIDDQIKRLGAVLSTGDNMRTQWMTKSNDPKVQAEINRLQDRQSYTCAIFNDNEIVSAQHEQLQNMFEFCNFRNLLKEKEDLNEFQIDELMKDPQAAHEKYPKIYSIAKALAKSDASAYGLNSKGTAGNINQADAAVYLSPQMYRDVVTMLGEWSDEIENAFNIMESDQDWLSNPELYAQSLKTLIKPLKTTYFGFRNDGVSNHNIPVFNKMAQFPMFKVLATGDNKEMYERMTATGKYKGLQPIDQIAFESAVKVGIEGASSLYTDYTNEQLNDLSNIHTTTQRFRNLRRQLITDPHTKDRTLFGTQVSTLSTSNLIFDRVYQEGTPNAITGTQIKDQLFSTINAISNKGIERTKKLYLDEDGKLDIKKLSRELIRAVNSSNMGSNLEQEVSLNEDGTDLNVPLSALPDSKWIETSIISDNNKRSVDIELAGGAFIQMSSFGVKSIDVVGDKSINKGKRLVNVNPDGSMDAIISINLFSHIIPGYEKMSFTQAKQWLLDNNIIGENATASALGYRIPTQGLSSIAGIKIVDVLPSVVGDTIILPDEFTTQTGSDFDIDKLYIARYNYKNGVKVEFTKDESDNFDEFLRQEYIRLMEPSNKEFADDDVLYVRWLDSLGNPQDVYEYNSKEANENLLLDTYFAVITDKKNVNETRLPLDKATGILKGEVLNIIDKFTPAKPFVPYNELSPTFQMNKKYEYSGGKTGIGPFALNNKNHVLTQLVGLKYASNPSLEALGFTGLDGISSQNNMVAKRDKDGKYILDKEGNPIMKQEQELNILSWLSAMIDAHVDVAKDPYVIRLNIKQYTYNICNFLLRSGFGRSTFYFLPQPILKEMSDAYSKTSGNYGVSETKSKTRLVNDEIEKIRKNYLSKLNANLDDNKYTDLNNFFVKNYLPNYIKQLMSRDSLIDLLEAGSKIDSLSKEKQAEYYKKQLLISEAFIKLNELAQDMSKLVQLSQVDTKRFGNNFVESDRFIGKIKSLMVNSVLFDPKDIANYYRNTFLYTKLMNGIVTPSKMFENILIRAKQAFKDEVTTILYMINRLENNDPDLNKKISNGLEGMVRWRFVEEKGIDTAKLLYGEQSIPTRLQNIKRDIYAGKYPKLLMQDGSISNPLLIVLDTLSKLSTDGYNSPSIVVKKSIDLEDQNLKQNLIEYWDELLESEYPEIREFANDLFYYELITTAGSFTKHSIFNLAPISIIKESGYAEYMRNQTNLYSGIQDIAEYDNFFLNNWQDNKLVPQVEIYSEKFDQYTGQFYKVQKYPMILSNNLINKKTYPLMISLEHSNPTGANISKQNVFMPYIKVRIGYGHGPQDYVLYKLAGVTFNGIRENPLYVVTNKKGLDQGGRVIKEYDNYSNSAMSFNNIENSADAMKPIDKSIILNILKENPTAKISSTTPSDFLKTYVPILDYAPSTVALRTDLESMLGQATIEKKQKEVEVVYQEDKTIYTPQEKEQSKDSKKFQFADGTEIDIPFELNDEQMNALYGLEKFINNSDLFNNVITLKGYAGTGKTTIISLFNKYLNANFINPTFTSPTHRANAVTRQNNPLAEVKTLHSIFGLNPMVDLSKPYDIKELVTEQIRKPKIKKGSLLIIDEASMISDQLFDLLQKEIKDKGLRIIFVGDPKQLRPVKGQGISKVFQSNQTTQLELDKVERTGDNPILKESTNLRQGKDFTYETDVNSKGEGVEYMHNDKVDETLTKLIDESKASNNNLYFRILSATNDMIDDANDRVRTQLYGDNPNQLEVGDLLMGYANITIQGRGGPIEIIRNGIDYTVDSVSKEITKNVTLQGQKVDVRGFNVTLRNAFDGDLVPMKIFVLSNDNPTKIFGLIAKTKKDLELSISEAFKRRDFEFVSGLMKAKSDFDSEFVFMQDYTENGRTLLAKAFTYGYAHTIHKSQGGTYDKVMIYADTINKFDKDTAQELKYVAMSRAKSNVYVVTSYPIKEQVQPPVITKPTTNIKTYSGKITELKPNQIFVFGSNTQGRHGKGSALQAKTNFGAVYGQAEGPQGKSYAIITKDLTKPKHPSRTPEQIKEQISKLYEYAKQNPDKEFLVAYSSEGSNLNAYSNEEMASFFSNTTIPNNIVFEEGFAKLLNKNNNQIVSTSNIGKDYTIHSGGAVGADSIWGDIAEEYGIKVNHYYQDEKTPKGNIEISEQDYQEGREEVAKAAKANWGYIYQYMKDPLLISDWAQIKYSDQIFAVGTLLSKGKKISDKENETRISQQVMVKGGTGYAVEMAIQHGKEVYVYDQIRKQWFANKGGNWVRLSETPTITSKNFAGIGTRELNEAGEQAIRDVYNKTFNQKSEIDELAEKGKQRIIDCKG